MAVARTAYHGFRRQGVAVALGGPAVVAGATLFPGAAQAAAPAMSAQAGETHTWSYNTCFGQLDGTSWCWGAGTRGSAESGQVVGQLGAP